ncbi:copper resistance protein CopC [Kineosporia sp. A_224]|uniref:copper resistance protein CopC n=1 Tax=Kineosporia sp. A_224 TaxID=1962180 RepID=UPI000B4C0C60|nr:copper resistance protein CopC [Kineosporia sp. A_224]
MTARPRAVAAAALVLAGGLAAAPAAAVVAAAAPAGSAARSATRSSAALTRTAPVGVLRSDPENGSWARRTPEVVRLWFTSGAAARAAAVRVSTPRRASAADVRVSVSAAVLSVRLPDDGPGDYRVVWYVLPGGQEAGTDPGYDGTDGGGGAAGTVAFRVGGVRPSPGPGRGTDGTRAPGTPGADGFTIPDRSSTAAGRDDDAASPPTTTPTTTSPTTSPTTPPPSTGAARATTSRAGLPALPAGPAVAPADDPAVTAALLLTDPVGLGATGLAGLLAGALAARWSWRRGTAAGLRPR